MEVKKSIMEMTDEEYLQLVIGKKEVVKKTKSQYIHDYVIFTLEKYGNCFVDLGTLKLLNLEKLRKELKVKALETTDVPKILLDDNEGKVIWVIK